MPSLHPMIEERLAAGNAMVKAIWERDDALSKLAATESENASLRAKLDERQFPMQRGPSIPWSLAETIYAGYSACYGTDQSLEKLGARGGWSWAEVEDMWTDAGEYGPRFRAAIATHVYARQSAQAASQPSNP